MLKIVKMQRMCSSVRRVLQKTVQNCFCQNSHKIPPALIIFGTKMAMKIKLYDVHSFIFHFT